MSLHDDLVAYVQKTIDDEWMTREGQKVPEATDIKLGNDAVKLEGTVLYADLAESTTMVKSKKDWFAAEVYKNYLYCAARVITDHGGVITAYDGDRVMGVFIGSGKNTSAANCALKINYAVTKIIRPAMSAKRPKSTFVLRQKVGIDTSSLFVARTGIRGSNDLVWVGRSANYAAKMAALSTSYSSYISKDAYGMLNKTAKVASDGRPMWTALGSDAVGIPIYGSTFWRSF